VIRCKHCDQSTRSSLDVARMDGWRLFKGVSLTGKPLNDVVCPRCADTAKPPNPEPTWSVRCNTCDWEWEDEYGEGPLGAKEAKRMADDHECDPEMEIQSPDGGWHKPWSVNGDGSLKDDPRAANAVAS
jgi:hypothetical protein